MKRILFAFSGGIDDVLSVHWLRQVRGYSVCALLADVGQGGHLESRGERALEAGAETTVIVDLRRNFVEGFVLPALRAGARYEEYMLSTPLARYAISAELVRYARENGFEVIGHGASSGGNDQIRMEASFAALDPQLQIMAPLRDFPFRSLEERREYLTRHHLPVGSQVGDVSVDQNLWGCGQVQGGLSDPWLTPEEDLYRVTVDPRSAPDTPESIEVEFDKGVPVALDGESLPPLELVLRLLSLGGKHGVGRLDHVENSLMAGKTRDIYEAPAARLLYLAHGALEEITQTRDLLRFKRAIAEEYGRMVYEGMWFSELREALDDFVESSQRFVTGRIRLELYKGRAVVRGRESRYSLYDIRLTQSSEAQEWLRQRAGGFVNMLTRSRRAEAEQRRNPSET